MNSTATVYNNGLRCRLTCLLFCVLMMKYGNYTDGKPRKTDSMSYQLNMCSSKRTKWHAGEYPDNRKVSPYGSRHYCLDAYDDIVQSTAHSIANVLFILKNVDLNGTRQRYCGIPKASYSLHTISLTLIRLALLFLCICCSFGVKTTKSLKDVKSDGKLDSLLQYRVPILSETLVYHFSLKNYFTEAARHNASNVANKLMNYEWARYESFKTFPEYCIASPLRLAQFGFYYAGKGVEAICFKCGLRNAEWSEEETVAETHKRLAPNCKFINGEETDNVPIHGNETHGNNTSGACGGPSDITTTNTRTNAQSEHSTTHSGNNRNTEQHSGHTRSPTPDRFDDRASNVESSFQARNYTGQYSDYNPTEEIERFPGITHTRPKHPDYAIKSVRISSFSHWPFADTLNPADLADAGFFFVGTHDCVRCFFCGGGMKNWEYGDSPWIEHARWFPECPYVKQCKGEEFVNMCRMSHTGLQTQNNFEFDTHQTHITEDQYIKDLNSIAAKRVLDMGFYQPDVEVAVKHARQQLRSTEELNARHLLQYLLDNSYTTRHTDDATRVSASASENNSAAAVNRHQPVLASLPTNNNIDVPVDTSSSETIAENTPSETMAENTTSERRRTSQKDEKKVLKEENQQLKERMMCKICMDKDANIVFLPCGHLVSCVECAHALRKCAVCRTVIQGTVRAYPA